MDFGRTEPLYESFYPYGCPQKYVSFLMHVMNQVPAVQTKENKPPRSAAKNALFPDAVAPLMMVNAPGINFTSKGPSSNLEGVESPDGIPGHRNTALEKPTGAGWSLSSKGGGSTGAEREQAQSSTSSSCKKVSMRRKEIFPTHVQAGSPVESCFQYAPSNTAKIWLGKATMEVWR